jgi:hypothetical protein
VKSSKVRLDASASRKAEDLRWVRSFLVEELEVKGCRRLAIDFSGGSCHVEEFMCVVQAIEVACVVLL